MKEWLQAHCIPVIIVCSHEAHPLHHVESIAHTPKNRMLAVEKGRGCQSYELKQGSVRFHMHMLLRTNWLPFVFCPLLAIAKTPAPTNRSSGVISSSN